MIIRNRVFTLAAVAAFSMGSASAVVLVDQTPHVINNGYFADGSPGQYWDQRIADDFTLGVGAEITKVSWWGSSENFIFSDLSNFSAFVIRIYNDAGGTVGGEVFNTTLATAATNPTPTGETTTWGAAVYKQEATMSVNVGAGSFWVSVGATAISPGDDGYVWLMAQNTYNGQAAFESPFGAGYATFQGEELAYQIEGNPVPEPTTLLAIGVGIAAIAARRRRK